MMDSGEATFTPLDWAMRFGPKQMAGSLKSHLCQSKIIPLPISHVSLCFFSCEYLSGPVIITGELGKGEHYRSTVDLKLLTSN